MSERLSSNHPETSPRIEQNREQLEALRKDIEARAEQQKSQVLNTGELSKRVEQASVSGKEITIAEHRKDSHHPVFVNKQLKEMAYSRTMVRVQKHLSAPAKLLSKTMHSKFLDKPSEFAERTIARPSSLLGGGVFAALGTSLLLWVTRHYGYQFSYLTAILLFIIGMIVGFSAEVLVRTIKKTNK